jgi:thiol:disulfide interchange protein DsbD
MFTIKSLKSIWRAVFASLALLSTAVNADPGFLKAAEAYRYEASAEGQTVVVTYHIADGYYLYRKRFAFSTDTPGIQLEPALFPPGLPHSDEYFGEQEIYRNTFSVRIPFRRSDVGTGEMALTLRLQGCADAGLCYPPQTWTTRVSLPAPPPKVPAAEHTLIGKLVSSKAGNIAAQEAPPEFLPADQAFQMSASQTDAGIRVQVIIAPGYYLYRDRFHLKVDSRTTLGTPHWPAGEVHHDDYFGNQTVYRGDLEFVVPYTGAAPDEIELTYQGCADAGLCYTPQTVRRRLSGSASQNPLSTSNNSAATAPPTAEQDRLAQLVRSAPLWMIFGSFWFFGLLLAFTPCVLPMVPILAGIIAGDGPGVSARRSFSLSLAYVGGMAVTYTTVGVAFAAVGARTQAVFQQPWIIGGFALLFVVLAAAMFGWFELALPSGLQTRFTQATNRIRGGRLASTALLGALSSLIVTACVAPPLVATFIVIGQVGAISRGALALGALSLGMGTPLLLIGASAGRLLPKSGPWMETVKALFGVVFLAVAVWMLDRLVAARITMAGWAVVSGAAAVVLLRTGRRQNRVPRARWVLAGMFAAYALILLLSSLAGGSDPLHPSRGTPLGAQTPVSLPFRMIHSNQELDRVLAEAKQSGRSLMLDFSADWCVSCKEMDAHTFSDPRVSVALGRYLILRADVTHNSADDQALLARFAIVGPPTTAFIKPDGSERPAFRLVGYVNPTQFLQHLSAFEAAP